jgi:cysteine desulfurase
MQERGLRSGTVPHSLVVGLGKACEVAADEMQFDKAHVAALAERLYHGITSRLKGVVVNGPLDFTGHFRYPGNLNLSFAYVEGESLIMGLKVRISQPTTYESPYYSVL